MAARTAKAQAAVDAVKPSVSTMASAAGAALAVVVLWIVEQSTQLTIPAHVASALTSLVTIAAGFIFPGGRSVDTK